MQPETQLPTPLGRSPSCASHRTNDPEQPGRPDGRILTAVALAAASAKAFWTVTTPSAAAPPDGPAAMPHQLLVYDKCPDACDDQAAKGNQGADLGK